MSPPGGNFRHGAPARGRLRAAGGSGWDSWRGSRGLTRRGGRLGGARRDLTHVHQLLLGVKLLGTAVPVAVGFVDGLRLGFPVLLLQLVPDVEHAQQGVLGGAQPAERSRASALPLAGSGSGAREHQGAVPGVWAAGGRGLRTGAVPGCLGKPGWRCRPPLSPPGTWHTGGCPGSTPASAAAEGGTGGEQSAPRRRWSAACTRGARPPYLAGFEGPASGSVGQKPWASGWVFVGATWWRWRWRGVAVQVALALLLPRWTLVPR